jgi:hypothetical protein
MLMEGLAPRYLPRNQGHLDVLRLCRSEFLDGEWRTDIGSNNRTLRAKGSSLEYI